MFPGLCDTIEYISALDCKKYVEQMSKNISMLNGRSDVSDIKGYVKFIGHKSSPNSAHLIMIKVSEDESVSKYPILESA